jgi:type I restriction enzyme M protein
MNSATIVQKLWNYCNVLRDDGMSYGDYVEQLTYLLFLKMADERSQPPWSQPSPIAKGFDWPSLLAKDGDELFDHYRHLLDELGKEKGTIGLIFAKAQNKFQDPAKLRRLVVDLIDCENWSAMGADVKGDPYEGLLERKRAGHQERRWPVLHATPADPGHGRLHRAQTRRDGLRPGLGHRRVPVCRAQPCGRPQPQPHARAEETPERKGLAWLGAGAKHGAAGGHEHDAAWHRLRQIGADRGGRRTGRRPR